MLENHVEVEIIQPGRAVGVYTTSDCRSLHLDKILYPEILLPFDLAVIPNMLTPEGEQLQVILVGDVSHPPHARVHARLLGAIQNGKSEPYLLAVPAADQKYVSLTHIDGVPETVRADLVQYIAGEGGGFTWINLQGIEPFVRISHLNYLQAKAAETKLEASRPAWQPLDREGGVIGYTEAEHYTAAEYTYFQLPYRFQYYMNEHLAGDERILIVVHRPAMRSRRQRTWLGRKTLQEGVLILTDQRLVHLVELIPPGSIGIRYGFEAQVGVVERLVDLGIERLDDDALLLHTQWKALHGIQSMEWEFPIQNWSALEELAAFLKEFIPDAGKSSALQRVTLPPPPESLPPLRDPAANDPKELEPVNQRFSAHLSELLDQDEKAYAWALWPAWFEKNGHLEVLLISNRRLLVIPDPALGNPKVNEVSLADISTLEYKASILDSHICLAVIEGGQLRDITFTFPFPAETAFRECFEAIRRCMAVLPLAIEERV